MRYERTERRALLTTQVVTATPGTQAVSPGDSFSIDVDYSTRNDLDQPAQLQGTGLGLRLHYDSSAVTFTNVTDAFQTGLSPVSDQPESAGQMDNDSNTDRFVLMAWFDLINPWPGPANP